MVLKHLRPLAIGLMGGGLVLGLGLFVGITALISNAQNTNQTAEPGQVAAAETSPTPSPQTTPPTSPPEPKPVNTAPKPQPPATPGSVLNLSNWKLTLPVNTGHVGNPDEILQPELNSFTSAYFTLNSQKNGVIFKANAGGVTTSGSGYPRSELREMTNGGKTEASWSNKTESHAMSLRQAITHLPTVKPEVVSAQIHNSSDDVIMVKLSGKLLYVEAKSKNIGTLNADYILGTAYDLKIVAEGGRIKVFYNGTQKVDYEKSGSGYYFKAGCYTQSNTSKGDSPDAYGEVVIYSLSASG